MQSIKSAKQKEQEEGKKKKTVRETQTREAEIFAVAWHRATLICCIAQSCWAIIHTQVWTISQPQHTYARISFPILPVLLAASHNAPPDTQAMLKHVLPTEIEVEQANAPGLIGNLPKRQTAHVFKGQRQCTVC